MAVTYHSPNNGVNNLRHATTPHACRRDGVKIPFYLVMCGNAEKAAVLMLREEEGDDIVMVIFSGKVMKAASPRISCNVSSIVMAAACFCGLSHTHTHPTPERQWHDDVVMAAAGAKEMGASGLLLWPRHSISPGGVVWVVMVFTPTGDDGWYANRCPAAAPTTPTQPKCQWYGRPISRVIA